MIPLKSILFSFALSLLLMVIFTDCSSSTSDSNSFSYNADDDYVEVSYESETDDFESDETISDQNLDDYDLEYEIAELDEDYEYEEQFSDDEGLSSNPYADAVVSVYYGEGAGFGQDEFPDIVLGAPVSEGDSSGSLDVLSLGDCGSIVLEFVDNCLIDGEGYDLVVFENPFFVGSGQDNVFSETAVVDVSQNGTDWVRFPFFYNDEGSSDFEKFVGMAGLHPSGDGFDLASVGLLWARFVRITDTGKGDCAIHDKNGNFIDDAGNKFPCTNSCGFDLDAVKAVHSSISCP